MAKTLHVGFLLDETGSMFRIIEETLSGLNEYIDNLKLKKQRIRFTLIKFNDTNITTIYDNANIKDVKHLSKVNYKPASLTNLYDSIARLINKFEGKENVLIVIQTDGYENASVEYSRNSIRQLIETKQSIGWTFVFLGANIDAALASNNIGISTGNTLEYTSGESSRAFSKLSSATTSYMSKGAVQSSNFFEE